MKSGFRIKWEKLSSAYVAGAVAVLSITGCSFFGIRTSEEANYKILGESGQIEIREYDELVVVETDVDAPFDEASKLAFRKLFAYISGENLSKTKIAMTAPVLSTARRALDGDKIPMTSPVLSERQAEGWRYSFVLPANYTLENAPFPSNPEVKLASIPQKKVAVIRYTGSWNEQVMREKTEALVEWIQGKGLSIESGPRSAGYDPPWTLPFLRRNEIMIDIE